VTRKFVIGSLAMAVLGMSALANAQSARDSISIVGSSTVYPFTTTVAEKFGSGGKYKTPKVESTGTGGGLKLFCNGVGPQFPDIANASRRIKPAELQTCQQNGVKEVVEIKVGYDGIVLAQNKAGQSLIVTRKDVYLALAKNVPDPANPTTLIPNPNTTWKQVNSKLPNVKIEVLGPPPTSGTRDSFAELYLEAGENDNLIVQKLESNPTAIGIFGYSYLEENQDKIAGSLLEGVTPVFETIASGKYAASRPLFIYVKKAHMGVIPGIKEFVTEYVSDKALGQEGYLADKGLIPPSDAERAKIRTDALAFKNVKL